MNFDAQVDLFYHMEAGTLAHAGDEIETEEGVAVPVVVASQVVPLDFPHLTGRSQQVEVPPHVTVVGEIRLEWFVGYLSSVHIHGKEVDVVMLGVKRVLGVRTVARVVVDAAQHQSGYRGRGSRACVRPGSTRDGIDFVVDGTHRILDRALLERFDVRHLHG